MLPHSSVGKESTCNEGEPYLIPRWGRSTGEGKWLPTPVFLLGEFYGQRSLEGYSTWGHETVGHDLVIKQQQKGQ